MRSIVDRLVASLAVRRAYASIRGMPGVGLLVRRLLQRLSPPNTWRWMQIPRGPVKGKYMLVEPRYELTYVRGDHEPWLSEMLQRWLSPGDVFVDIGAHIGYFTLCAAEVVGPEGRVLAFEPDPDNHTRLSQILARNQLLGVVSPIRAAVGGRNGNALFERSDTPRSSLGRLAELPAGSGERVRVPVLTLDSAIGDLVPRAIKVDVEGDEVEVLRGATRTLADFRPCWVVEVHGEGIGQSVLGMLKQAKYRVRWLRPTQGTYPDYRQQYVVAEPITEGERRVSSA